MGDSVGGSSPSVGAAEAIAVGACDGAWVGWLVCTTVVV